MGIAVRLQSFPIYSVRSLMMDAFIAGFFSGINKNNKNPQLEMTINLIEQINIQLQEDLITLE
jgi:hypothetical protein